MKEIKIWLDTPQSFFLEKVMNKIETGKFKVYGRSTIAGLRVIVDRGWYSDTQKEWLMTIREDYLECFCRGGVKGSLTWDSEENLDELTWSM